MKPTIYIPSALARLLIPRLPTSGCRGADEPALEWRTRFSLESGARSRVWRTAEMEGTAALPCCA